MSLLEVEGLTVGFCGGPPVVDGVSFGIAPGESLGLLGASGSGKSLTALALMGLLPAAAEVRAGKAVFEGRDLLALDAEGRRALRGGAMALVFQEPMTALNPLMTVGAQIAECFRLRGLDAARARREAALALEQVGLAPGEERARRRPHQLSGGMRQRVLLAMALAGRPRLLIADEPTTALDSTVQARILELVRGLRDSLGFSLLVISHDLGVVHALARRAVVLERGRVVERGDLVGMLGAPRSPALRRLALACAEP